MKKAKPSLPRIHAHFAVTADGRISTREFSPSLFTSPADKARLHTVRAAHDAILAGRGTVAADSMSMRLSREDLRAQRVEAGKPPEPLRVIISNKGSLDPGWKVFRHRGSPIVVLSTHLMPPATRRALEPLCELRLWNLDSVPLREALSMLRSDHDVRSLVCEGGGELLRSLAEEDLLDEIHLTVAPVVFGGRGAPSLTGLPAGFLPAPRKFRITSMEVAGGECFLTLRRQARRT
jgi:riboflavin-specific deaminase-like protein